MMRSLAVVLSSILFAFSAFAAGKQRQRGVCVAEGPEDVSRYEWQFPVVDVGCRPCNRVINEAIEAHVLQLLDQESFAIGRPCNEIKPAHGVYALSMDISCEITFRTPRFVSVQCSMEGYAGTFGFGRSSLLFVVEPNRRATRYTAATLFSNGSHEILFDTLQRIIRTQRDSEAEGPNAGLPDDEIPKVAASMLSSLWFEKDGVHFVGVDGGHTYFETTLPFETVRKWLAVPVAPNEPRRR